MVCANHIHSFVHEGMIRTLDILVIYYSILPGRMWDAVSVWFAPIVKQVKPHCGEEIWTVNRYATHADSTKNCMG